MCKDKAKLCYMDTDSFIVHMKTKHIFESIAPDAKTRFDTSNYDAQRPLPLGKNKKVIGLIKDELGGRIMKTYTALRPKMYNYLVMMIMFLRKKRMQRNL